MPLLLAKELVKVDGEYKVYVAKPSLSTIFSLTHPQPAIMVFESVLMAITSAFTMWVIQVENGGLLNVFFSTGQKSSGETLFNATQLINYDYILNMILLRPLALPILEALPESMGGGRAGVAKAHSNPNREPIIFWVTITVLMFTAFLIVVIQIINHYKLKKVTLFLYTVIPQDILDTCFSLALLN